MLLTILLFLCILTGIVLVHECGHFFVARFFGMRVHEFGVGFPPRLFGWYKDPVTKKWVSVRGKGAQLEQIPGTVYSINALPIGGFVKVKGESGEDREAVDSFAHHAAWKRLCVLVAGVFMNIVLAGVLLGIGFMIGLPTDIREGIPNGATLVQGKQIMIEDVRKDSPADRAGFAFGDAIVRLNGEAVTSVEDTTRRIGMSTEPLVIEYNRGGKTMTTTVSPETITGEEGVKLGVVLAEVGRVRFPWYIAIPKGFVAAVTGLINIFIALFTLLRDLMLGQGATVSVSGPVGIASVVGKSAGLGMSYVIQVAAMISLSLAAMNILPIPALDGGRAFFVLLEMVLRRKVAVRFEEVAHTVGFLLLIGLILLVTVRDVIGLFH